MKRIFILLKGLSRFLYWISFIALLSIMGLTVLDVILRRLKIPIDFTYEIVIFLGVILIGFSLPKTTLEKGHIIISFLPDKLPSGWKRMLSSVTRCFGIALFAILGWNVIGIASSLRRAGQVSPILEIPEYPIPYSLGICCFVVCLILLYDLYQKLKGVKD